VIFQFTKKKETDFYVICVLGELNSSSSLDVSILLCGSLSRALVFVLKKMCKKC
jgi:hypothetical protein